MSKVLARWNEKYAADDFIFGEDPTEYLTQRADLLPKTGKVLVPGDGEGRNGVWLAKQGLQVLSVDGAENGVKKALRKAKLNGVEDRVEGLCVDLLKWDWPVNTYDAVVSLHLHFYKDEKRLMNKAMLNALKDGGIFMFEAFHPDQIGRDSGGPKDVDLCYTAEELAKDCADCEILHIEECEKSIISAPHRPGGPGVVSRIIARK